MRPVQPEKYVDGMRVDGDEERLAAHTILAEHVSNVSPVTAKVIKRAIAEHEALKQSSANAARAQPAAAESPAQPAQHLDPAAESIESSIAKLTRLIEATDLLDLAVSKMKDRVQFALDSVKQLKVSAKPNNGRSKRANGEKR